LSALEESQWKRKVEPLRYDLGELETKRRLQKTIVWFVFPTYVFTVVSTFALIFLDAFSVATLPDELLPWLGPTVIGEFVSSAGVIIISLFRKEA